MRCELYVNMAVSAHFVFLSRGVFFLTLPEDLLLQKDCNKDSSTPHLFGAFCADSQSQSSRLSQPKNPSKICDPGVQILWTDPSYAVMKISLQ